MQQPIQGVIGVTDDGQPIVTQSHSCPHWVAHSELGLCPIQECWYCYYADFRKSTDVMLKSSICRHPQNRLEIEQDCKNEG